MPKVSLFIPCFVDQFFPETGLATVDLLRRAGCEVEYSREQTCCGQPSHNSGFRKDTKVLAEKFIRLFSDAEVVVAPSASCVAMVRLEYGKLDLDPGIRKEWEALCPRLFELSEYLVDELRFDQLERPFPHRVAYHASCHGLRELNIYEQPLALLRTVPAIELVELDDRHACCGFGGTFAAKFSNLSTAIGQDKLEAIQRSGAEVVTATDDSCLMHIAGLASRQKLPFRTMHYARILAGEVLK